MRLTSATAPLDAFGPESPRSLVSRTLQDRWLRIAAGFALGLGVLAALASVSDFARLGAAVAELARRPLLVLLFLLPYTAAFWLRALAWRSLLPGLSAASAFSVLQAALFANHVLPIKAGEALRPYLASRRGLAIGEAAATSVLARMLDFLCLLAVAGALLAFASGSPLVDWPAAIAPAGVLLVGGALILWLRSSVPLVGVPEGIRDLLRPVSQALRRVTGRQLLTAALWTLPSWVLEGAVLFVAAEVLGVPLAFEAAVAATAFTILFQAFHLTPGGLGVYEATMTAALAANGIPAQEALVLALLAHGLKFAYSYTVGLWSASVAFQDLLPARSSDAQRPVSLARPAAVSRLPFLGSALGVALVLTVGDGGSAGGWARAAMAVGALLPLALVVYRLRFPGVLRLLLLVLLLGAWALLGQLDGGSVLMLAGIYACLAGPALVCRGEAWREALLDGLPKALLLVLIFQAVITATAWSEVAGAALFALAVTSAVLLAHQWLPGWTPRRAAVEQPHRSGPLAVIIPAYNEAANLSATLAALPLHRVQDMRVIVVDDGSTDGTREVAEANGADLIVRHERNRGLGAALRTGLAAARNMDCRAAVYIDADGEYDPAEVPAVLAPIEAGVADYVLGSRYLGRRRGQLWSRNLANRVFTVGLCIAAGRRISDGQTGFRAFSRRAVDAAEIIHDYNYAQVLTLDLLRKRMRLAEVPITWRRRSAGTSFVRSEYLWRVPLGIFRQLLRA